MKGEAVKQRIPWSEPYLDPPDLPPMPRCPVCGEECEEVYVDIDCHVVGCDCCMEVYNAIDYFEEDE